MRRVLSFAAFLSVILPVLLVAQPTPIASQTYQVGVYTLGPFTKPAGATSVQVVLAAPTDWQTGPAGRVLKVTVNFSTDGGATWRMRSSNGSGQVTPNMGKAVAMPTFVDADISIDPVNTQYQVIADLSGGPLTAGFTVNVQ